MDSTINILFISIIIKGNYLVVVVVVVVFLTGLLLDCPGTMSSGGGLPPKSCLATQHFRSDLHSPPMSRMASQNPERRSATHTPGHVSARGAIEGGKVEDGGEQMRTLLKTYDPRIAYALPRNQQEIPGKRHNCSNFAAMVSKSNLEENDLK